LDGVGTQVRIEVVISFKDIAEAKATRRVSSGSYFV
jgi:hypothetical protein